MMMLMLMLRLRLMLMLTQCTDMLCYVRLCSALLGYALLIIIIIIIIIILSVSDLALDIGVKWMWHRFESMLNACLSVLVLIQYLFELCQPKLTFGFILDPLGSMLVPFCVIFMISGSIFMMLGSILDPFGPLGLHLGSSWALWAPCWSLSAPCWSLFAQFLRFGALFWTLLAALGIIWGHLGSSLDDFGSDFAYIA